ncbi:protein FosB isoform X1 [Anas acuta]|uniref:FosB proto-oncogene, AP-1 transcription factor subunit n=1 Tax=Anas zonorhyncha TaxID=75864 RepID=A0A8B9VBN9_9AVES|nr:protein fosB [Anas platyrhynchos]
MYQGFPGDYDSGSRCSSSPSAESQYLSSVDSFGSPAAAAAAQECSGLGDMPGSFVPTVTAITTSQDLQWLVQPTLISSVAQSQPPGGPMAHPPPPTAPVDPYDLPGPSYSAPGMGGFPSAPPARPARARPRRSREETLTPEEEEKRRVRRERNKLAAAKCRNRRRELTDRLQAETDQLEEEKAELESEIAELQKEKERLEFVLVAHAPACKLPFEDAAPLGAGPPEVSTLGKEEPPGPVAFPFQPGPQGPFPSCCFAPGAPPPVPPNPSYTSSFVFTYPEGATCGASHQRSSSSDQSSDSLNSPSLLAL